LVVRVTGPWTVLRAAGESGADGILPRSTAGARG